MTQLKNEQIAQVTGLIEQYFPPELQKQIIRYDDSFDGLQEIRCRVNQPVILRYMQNEEQQIADAVQPAQMQYIVSRISQGSAYAWEEEFRRGYLTLPGGCRVGLTGKGVLENGRIRTLTQINALNFRIVRECPGAANLLMPLLYQGQHIVNCLLVSPPGGGKTTMLRDMVRQLSNGVEPLNQSGRTVAVVDERSEIAGCIQGIPQMDVGCRTDVLDGCPKSEGISMLIRSMAPQIIAVDEIGTKTDVQALEEAAKSGVAVMATAHGNSMENLYQHPVLASLIAGGYFALIVFLHWQNGQIVLQVYTSTGGDRYAADRCDINYSSWKCYGVLQSV